jgi:cytochrome P450
VSGSGPHESRPQAAPAPSTLPWLGNLQQLDPKRLPERWVGARESTRDGHNTKAFLHFGAGPRICPGRHLATLEMKMVLAMLARNFSLEHAEDPDITQEVFAFTMMPSQLRLRLRAMA